MGQLARRHPANPQKTLRTIGWQYHHCPKKARKETVKNWHPATTTRHTQHFPFLLFHCSYATMTIDSTALAWGSGFIAFAPMLCLFFQITFPKSQLIIVFTTAAFFFLLAGLSASIIWYILDPVIGLGGAWSALLPGVLCQFMARCLFVSLYHRVELVIEQSIEKGEQQGEDQRDGNGGDANASSELEAAKLKLELNDVASGLAAGTGFGGMHAILLYGTLLASESADLGVLYQPSCPYLPALIVSALNCFSFGVLDVFWMLLTFFGMRRRLIFPRGGGTINEINPWRRTFGHYFGNTRTGGNMALMTVLIGHLLAAGFTTFNQFQYGCAFSLSLVPVVVLVTAYLFWSGVSKIYMPLPNSTHRLTLPASFSYGSRAEDGDFVGMNDDDDDEPQDQQQPTQVMNAPLQEDEITMSTMRLPPTRNVYHQD